MEERGSWIRGSARPKNAHALYERMPVLLAMSNQRFLGTLIISGDPSSPDGDPGGGGPEMGRLCDRETGGGGGIGARERALEKRKKTAVLKRH